MEAIRAYLKNHAAGDPLIQATPENGLKYIVVIPTYLESRLEECLDSLFNAASPSYPVEVIVVVNWPEDESKENILFSRNSLKASEKWMAQHSSEKKQFRIVVKEFIPRKKAGVGYARKVGMDEAVRRFLKTGQKDGIIISLDADTKCDPDYLTSIEEHFLLNPLKDGCSVYFEHPLDGTEYNSSVYEAVTQYELHMRYYLHALKFSGFPNAFYTVGSAFVIRATSYCRQGGMNIRQAGEDFYFLQKFFDLGNFSDLLKTRVCPSPRPSLRVPFGTGKAIDQLLNSGESLKSYNPEIFDILREFFQLVPIFYQQISSSGIPYLQEINPCLLEFMDNTGFEKELLEIYKNSGSHAAFNKRFYRYFNMFRILKFVKHARKTFPDLPVALCAKSIMHKTGMNVLQKMTEKEMLTEFRRIDRMVNDLR